MNLVNSSWNWLTACSAWNIPREVRETEGRLRDKGSPILVQQITIGLWDGLSGMPKRLLISALATATVSYIFPPVAAISPECLALANASVPPSMSLVALKTLLWVVGEELVFRVGVQNLLQRLEHSSSPVLASLGSLQNRTLISSILFSANHLNYYLFGNACSSINNNMVQVIRNIFDANYTALYENYGVAATFSSHLINNAIALVPLLIAKAIGR